MSNWMYDEYKHCGVDYSNEEHVNNYDGRHQSFRDYEKEFNDMVEFLCLKKTHELSVIDLGCGTGASLIYAKERFKKVYGVDVSDVMIQHAKRKVTDEANNNIEFVNAGFLSYKHKGEPVDLLITKFAFHHLPDFWKQIALLNMNKMIKKDGILYIFDVVFHLSPTEYKNVIDKWLSDFDKNTGVKFREEVETHIREEYSTFKWILDGMIERAGFRIENCRSKDGFITEYHCIKVNDMETDI